MTGKTDEITVAVPEFNGSVAPRLDCASKILIAHLKNGKIKDKQELNLNDVSPYQITGLLAEKGVQKVICYHLCRRDWYCLKANGIEVMARISGNVEGILKNLASGQLSSSCAMPFWRKGADGICRARGRTRKGRRKRGWKQD